MLYLDREQPICMCIPATEGKTEANPDSPKAGLQSTTGGNCSKNMARVLLSLISKPQWGLSGCTS